MQELTSAFFDHIFSRLPQTPLGWVVQIAAGIAVTLVSLTFFEWYIHKNMMHKKGLPRFLYPILPTLERLVHRHAVMHHNQYYKQFDFEPDPAGKHENINIRFHQTVSMGSVLAPLIVVIGYFSIVGAFCFMLGGYLHNKAWNILHNQMHMPKDVWWKDSWYFRSVAYHHFLHHQFQNMNMNVVLPGADFVLGTSAKPRLGDIREMLRLGYVKPRSERVKKLVGQMKPHARYTFLTEPMAQPHVLKAA